MTTEQSTSSADTGSSSTSQHGHLTALGRTKTESPAPRSNAAVAARRRASRTCNAFYGDKHSVKGVNLEFEANKVTAIIGPSGCGKSTLVRCINRMHEEIPGARVTGKVTLDGEDIYDPGVDVVAVRHAIGMVFQKPNPFPTMSIFDNVAAGPRLSGVKSGNLNELRREERCAAPASGTR